MRQRVCRQRRRLRHSGACSAVGREKGVDVLENDCLHEDVLTQLEALQLVPDRPLIISDADEVIFAFVRGLETYLLDNGHFMDLKSFAMRGNIRDSETGEAVSAHAVKELINGYFLERTEQIEPVDGAAAALEALAQRAQILVLSNTPLVCHEARRRALVKNGMDYPLVANMARRAPLWPIWRTN